jgi:predicted aldo/keto reductase-like oxidoreductase
MSSRTPMNDPKMPQKRTLREVSRRDFLRTSTLAAGAGLALSAAGARLGADESETPAKATPPVPRKPLGRTGLEVSILGLGTALLGHQNGNNPEIPKLVRVFSDAIDRGITYVDTARIYGGAEEALSQVLPGRRDKVVLATKVWADTYEAARESFEKSLSVMKLEEVDILHLHNAGSKDIDKVLGKGGSWEFIQEAKKAGRARFIGITGHEHPQKFVRMLETGTVDVLMIAMNFVDRFIYGFEDVVLPVARKHATGVLAMKVFGGVEGGFRNYPTRTPRPSQLAAEHHLSAIRYAKSLEGVAGMVIGVHTSEQVHRNIEMVVSAEPLSPAEFAALYYKGKAISADWSPRFGPPV